ncbi:MAG TPA: hypothetical protein VF548_07170 [Allosphingosinicella sp.]
MIFRLRFIRMLLAAAVVATVAAWFSGFVPLIYMMPLLVVQALVLSLACPRCGRSPFVRRWGNMRVGWPHRGARCRNCEFRFRGSWKDG